DVVPGRVGIGADRAARGLRGSADMRLDAAHVVPAEQLLDRGSVGQRPAGAGDAVGGGVLDGAGSRVAWDLRRTFAALHRELLDGRPLADVDAPRDRALRTAVPVGVLSSIDSTAHNRLLQELQ